jgi:hypothetical protein
MKIQPSKVAQAELGRGAAPRSRCRPGPGGRPESLPRLRDFGELNSIFGEPTVQIRSAVAARLVGAPSAEEDRSGRVVSQAERRAHNVFETCCGAGAVTWSGDAGKPSTQGWGPSSLSIRPTNRLATRRSTANGRHHGDGCRDTGGRLRQRDRHINPAELERVMDTGRKSAATAWSRGMKTVLAVAPLLALSGRRHGPAAATVGADPIRSASPIPTA